MRLAEYVKARAAHFYRISTELAARKQVDMERARTDLEEHRLACQFAPNPKDFSNTYRFAALRFRPNPSSPRTRVVPDGKYTPSRDCFRVPQIV